MMPKDTWNESTVSSISMEALIHQAPPWSNLALASCREEALCQKPRLVSVDGSGDLRDFERLFIAA